MSLQIQDLQLYIQGIPPLPENKQRVWNMMGQGKMAMDQALQAAELKISNCLNGYEAMEYEQLQAAIKDFKGFHEIMVDIRKKYTSYLDAAKEMCMAPEKKWEPKTNPIYIAATKREFELREAAHNAANAANLKSAEEQAFRTFIVNEYQDIVNGYEISLLKIIQQAYNVCLQQRTPVEKVGPAFTAAVAAMRDIRPRVINKMERHHTTDSEAMKIFDTVPSPTNNGTYQNVFNRCIEVLKSKFSLYANDLANADTALVKQQEIFNQQQQDISNKNEAEKAANSLLSQATVPVVTPTGMKPITEATEIKIDDYSDTWVATIISAFLANFQICMPKVKNKKKSELKVAQMAAALDAAGVKVDGVEYVTLKK